MFPPAPLQHLRAIYEVHYIEHLLFHPIFNRSYLNMASEMQNSNPTILNTADLPTRLRLSAPHKSSTYGSEFFASALPSLTIDVLSDYSPSTSESENDDDLLEEPIDEQEVYGKTGHLSCIYHPPI